jgi:chemotaxis protein histidine kinase CheA
MFKRLIQSATDGAKALASTAADVAQMAAIGQRLQSLVSAGNFTKLKALADSLVAATGAAAGSVNDAPAALKKIFDPAHLATMWDLVVRITKSIIFLRTTIKTTPAVADPLKEVLASIRALRAVKTAADMERCVRDLEAKLKKARSLIGADGGMVAWLFDSIIAGIANIVAKGFNFTGDFVVGVAIDSIDTQLSVLEIILSYVLE